MLLGPSSRSSRSSSTESDLGSFLLWKRYSRIMSKPLRNAGITKEVLLAEMAASGDPKLIAMIPKLKSVKGWTVDQLFEILCEMKGVESKDVLK